MIPFKDQHVSLLVLLDMISPEILSAEQRSRVEDHKRYMKSPDADDMLLAEMAK